MWHVEEFFISTGWCCQWMWRVLSLVSVSLVDVWYQICHGCIGEDIK